MCIELEFSLPTLMSVPYAYFYFNHIILFFFRHYFSNL